MKRKVFLLDKNYRLKINKLENYIKKKPNKKFIIFGFTSYIWEFLINELKKKKIKLQKNNGILIHGGGWKKLEKRSITRKYFNNSILKNLRVNSIHNYYGMIEQAGSIFMECKEGNFHSSIFSDVIVRDENMKICKNKKSGLIQVLSLLPVIILVCYSTEDIANISEDDCQCGRKGKYF